MLQPGFPIQETLNRKSIKKATIIEMKWLLHEKILLYIYKLFGLIIFFIIASCVYHCFVCASLPYPCNPMQM